ncbi:golgin candidate 5 [Prunus dulcis]|uniref:Golgin candidate 5 n=1 Tax=Prunus dulcis TaxID=3755 RepID=A0A4Y1RGF2_PRUDU|nr:golgin candidate 5 [Prunus dulcis]
MLTRLLILLLRMGKHWTMSWRLLRERS